MHQIGTADNADDTPGAGHGDALNTTALHHLDGSLERFVFTDCPWIGSHDFSDFSAPCLHVFLGELSRSEDEFEPFRPLPLGAQLPSAQEIAFGDDTDQFAFLIEYRQAADVGLEHQAYGFQDWLIGVDANDFPRHYVFDSHGRVPDLEFARR